MVSSLWVWPKEKLRQAQSPWLQQQRLFIAQDLGVGSRYQIEKKSTTFLGIINEYFCRKMAWIATSG